MDETRELILLSGFVFSLLLFYCLFSCYLRQRPFDHDERSIGIALEATSPPVSHQTCIKPFFSSISWYIKFSPDELAHRMNSEVHDDNEENLSTPSPRFMISEGQVVGFDNSLSKYDEDQPIKTRSTPFEERIAQAMLLEKRVAAAQNEEAVLNESTPMTCIKKHLLFTPGNTDYKFFSPSVKKLFSTPRAGGASTMRPSANLFTASFRGKFLKDRSKYEQIRKVEEDVATCAEVRNDSGNNTGSLSRNPKSPMPFWSLISKFESTPSTMNKTAPAAVETKVTRSLSDKAGIEENAKDSSRHRQDIGYSKEKMCIDENNIRKEFKLSAFTYEFACQNQMMEEQIKNPDTFVAKNVDPQSLRVLHLRHKL